MYDVGIADVGETTLVAASHGYILGAHMKRTHAG